jgi:hypothetical protein
MITASFTGRTETLFEWNREAAFTLKGTGTHWEARIVAVTCGVVKLMKNDRIWQAKEFSESFLSVDRTPHDIRIVQVDQLVLLLSL